MFSSVVRTEMSISLDNPGFLLDVSDQVDVHQPDSSAIASGSSSSGESTRRSCPRCHGRMSSISVDRHVFCVKCRGAECDHNSRCDDCMKWSKEEMDSYVKLRKSLKLNLGLQSHPLGLLRLLLGPLPLILTLTRFYQRNWILFRNR